jgi:FKBP-type peptidyl-prolyl cis-trans isomerase (trigger factor)
MVLKDKSKKLKSEVTKKAKNLRKKLSKKGNKKRFGFIAILLLLVAFLYIFRGVFFVAIVNNRPITRLEFIKELEKNVGEQALEGIITRKLILQEASKEGINVSRDEIEKEIENISSMIEEQGGTLEQVLTTQGQTIKQLEENVRMQKTIEKLFEDKVQVSEEDAKQYFESNPDFYGEDADFSDVKENVMTQLRQEKISTQYSSWLANLKTQANIIYLLDL